MDDTLDALACAEVPGQRPVEERDVKCDAVVGGDDVKDHFVKGVRMGVECFW
jgi:hypothetical protein